MDTTESAVSRLSQHDWLILSNTWSRGADWSIAKHGRKWKIAYAEMLNIPLFNTKREAAAFFDDLILSESRRRAQAA